MNHHNYVDVTGFTLIPAKNPVLSLDADCELEEFNREVNTLQENCQSNHTVMKIMLLSEKNRNYRNHELYTFIAGKGFIFDILI